MFPNHAASIEIVPSSSKTAGQGPDRPDNSGTGLMDFAFEEAIDVYKYRPFAERSGYIHIDNKFGFYLNPHYLQSHYFLSSASTFGYYSIRSAGSRQASFKMVNSVLAGALSLYSFVLFLPALCKPVAQAGAPDVFPDTASYTPIPADPNVPAGFQVGMSTVRPPPST